jgi:uncharacterized SAM-binding protein YcdF (DUF218 family)
MFFFLSKTVPYLFMPLTLITILLVFSLFLPSGKWKKRLQVLSVMILLVCSNAVVTNGVFKLWEIPATPIEEISNSKKVGVVLSGIIKKEKLPHDRVYFSEGADRIMHALQLYKERKIQKIVISGGIGSFTESPIREAAQLKQVLMICEVPEADIVIENQSRNTRQNAQYTAAILREQFPDYDYLLITSAFHMRRSIACFEKEGIQTTAFSTDFKTGDYPPKLTAYLFPSPNAIFRWHTLAKEIMGMVAYKLAGYI